MLAHPAPPEVDLRHVDVATHLLHHYAAPVGAARLVGQGKVTARFLSRLLAHRPDVVHLTTSYDTAFLRDTLFVTAARAVGSAMVLNIRGGDFERFAEQQSAVNRQRILRVLRRCTAIVPVTHTTAAYLRSRGLDRVCVIPNCVDVRDAVRQPVGTSRWLFVGWVMPAKGIRELLEAVAAVGGANLTIAGPPVTQDRIDGAALLESECRRLAIVDRVRHVPEASHDDVRRLYREHDIFVFPSHREGFPNVVLEAMEAGMPVVASSVGAIPEMVRDGQEGFLTPVGDVAGLVTALRRYREDPTLAVRHGAAGRQRVLECFTVDRVAAQWYSLYSRVARDPLRWQAAVSSPREL
jgi:glycosyltransferase involved in cell wall biosynthesis